MATGIYGKQGELIERVDTLDDLVGEHLNDDTTNLRHLSDLQKSSVLTSRADITGDDILVNRTVTRNEQNKNGRIVVKRIHDVVRGIFSIEKLTNLDGNESEIYDRWITQVNHNLSAGEFIQANDTQRNDGYYFIHSITPNTFTTLREFLPVNENQGAQGNIAPDRSALIEWDEANTRFIFRIREPYGLEKASLLIQNLEIEDLLIHGVISGTGGIDANTLQGASKSIDKNDNSDATIWTTKAAKEFILIADVAKLSGASKSINKNDNSDTTIWTTKAARDFIATLIAISIGYNNLGSGLVATNVQTAIDEVVDKLIASEISYDNSSSGLIAIDVQEAIDELSDLNTKSASEIIEDNTSKHEIVLSDIGKLIKMTSGSANEVEIPLNSSAPIPILKKILVWQYGAGTTTITAAIGVTIRTPETVVFAKQYALACLTKVGTNEWLVTGYMDTI